MKILLTGKNSKDIESLVRELGFEIVTENPEVIISYGGDGTLLSSEREYPSIQKLPIRNSAICKKCPDHDEKVLLKKLLAGQLTLKEYRKLETEIEGSPREAGKTLTALNDFVIRNKDAIHSIRFRMTVPSHPGQPARPSGVDPGSINNNLFIGDGIVVSTPYGSSGYFKSITGQTFKDGFALAFNNTTEKKDPQFLKEGDQVVFKLSRGQAALTSDNSPDIYLIPEGMEITFKLSDQVAKIYELDSLRCPNCIVTRG